MTNEEFKDLVLSKAAAIALAARVIETPEGNFWIPPRFGDSVTPRQVDCEIRIPYWTTGVHCPMVQTCGRSLTLDEVEKYLGTEAKTWAESYGGT